ncbi:hypothetical protein INT45_005603 [Circinella minor]|uniref:Uncharacterized protein n=1 Tax=Circinella minor TaxID=1195481 RepID=A0A8H7S807_9FUNG|nr:hypothetical protein INT45_005603 [Circinella minor]
MVCAISLNEIFKRKKHEIDRYETTYNFRLIWPLFVTIMDSLYDAADGKFIPGEIKLESFKRLGAQYNADGLCYIGDMEVLVLETSGWGYDHIKGTFALLAMFRSFIQKYYYALPREFAELKLWFAHAREQQISFMMATIFVYDGLW